MTINSYGGQYEIIETATTIHWLLVAMMQTRRKLTSRSTLEASNAHPKEFELLHLLAPRVSLFADKARLPFRQRKRPTRVTELSLALVEIVSSRTGASLVERTLSSAAATFVESEKEGWR